jgi:hypothetical protein
VCLTVCVHKKVIGDSLPRGRPTRRPTGVLFWDNVHRRPLCLDVHRHVFERGLVVLKVDSCTRMREEDVRLEMSQRGLTAADNCLHSIVIITTQHTSRDQPGFVEASRPPTIVQFINRTAFITLHDSAAMPWLGLWFLRQHEASHRLLKQVLLSRWVWARLRSNVHNFTIRVQPPCDFRFTGSAREHPTKRLQKQLKATFDQYVPPET